MTKQFTWEQLKKIANQLGTTEDGIRVIDDKNKIFLAGECLYILSKIEYESLIKIERK